MTLIIGLALCVLAVIGAGAFIGGRWLYRRGWKVGFDAASGRTPVTPLRPKVEQRTKPKRIPTWKRRGGDGGLAS